MRQRRKTTKIIDTFLVIAVIALLVLAIPFVIAYFDKKPESINDIVASCQNRNLEDSSKCVLNITKGFYKYNLDNVSKDLTFEELKEQGGVCSSWSEYYSDLGSKLGFQTKNIVIPTSSSGNIYHEFSVWSSEKEYCILDQTKATCIQLQ